LLILLIFTSILVFLNVFFSANPLIDAITAGLLLGFVLLTRWLLLRGQVRASAILLTGGLWLTLVGATFINQFEGNGPFVGLVFVVIIAGLLLGSKTGLLVALLRHVVYSSALPRPNTILPVIVPAQSVTW
jgi:hypothetical protein